MSNSYSDAHLDAEILRTQRSDWSFVATRVVLLAMTFYFLGRAVTRGATAAYLLLPLAAEFATIMWLGLLLSMCVVNAPVFVATYRKPGRVVFWTLILVSFLSVAHGWESEAGFDVGRIGPGWVATWGEVVRTGLIWALVVDVVGLVVSTARELVSWRSSGGVFLWRSVFSPSFRVAVVVLMAIFSPFVLIPLADSVLPWLLETPRRTAWTAFAFLLLVEVGALALGVWLHRDAGAEKK